MEMTRLGSVGPAVSRVGLGCMALSGTYGPAEEAESLATIRTALDAGISLLDTGDFYGMGHNELLIADALKGRARDDVLISVKFGAQRGPDGSWLGYDARPPAVKTALAYSLQRLGTDHVEIYRPARLDPHIPIEETVGAIAEMIQAGYVRFVGLSEVGADTIRRAAAVHPICDLQIEYSLVSRAIEQSILPALRESGIAATVYGVLSRGLLSNSRVAEKGDFRVNLPRFDTENQERNHALVQDLARLAAAGGVTPVQLAIAWVLAKGDGLVPVIGARTRAQVRESLGALDVALSPEAVKHLEEVIPPERVAGTRYDAHQMKTLDSEK
jgi:aryl-alcohol dehydrogenase-like predicted oxidoreductase